MILPVNFYSPPINNIKNYRQAFGDKQDKKHECTSTTIAKILSPIGACGLADYCLDNFLTLKESQIEKATPKNINSAIAIQVGQKLESSKALVKKAII